MNRRGFLGALLKAGVGFAVLPSAVTYARKWQPVASGLVVPPTATIELPCGPRYHTITILYNGKSEVVYDSMATIRVSMAGQLIREHTPEILQHLNALEGLDGSTIRLNEPWRT